MKRVYYSFIFLLFSFGCSSIEEDKSMLQESINNYEGYHPYDAKDFPLGNHTEDRYQADYDFYGNLLEEINRNSIFKPF